MASIDVRPRKDGTAAFQVRWREHGRPASTTCDTLPRAKRVKAIVEATGSYTDAMGAPDVPTVAEVADAWLDTGTRAGPATLRDYRRALDRHILPTFGELAVSSLTAAQITTWARALPVADKTRHNLVSLLSGVLRSAVPEWLPVNPCERVRLARTDPPKARPPLGPADLALILAEIPAHWQPLVLTLTMTGMRWGEAAALTVSDVDTSSGFAVLHITKAMTHRARQGDQPGRPKTDRSVRTVTGDPALVPHLAPLLARAPSAPLFTAPRGGRILRSTFHTSVWQPALDRAQARGLAHRPRVHDLRAVATTWMIERSVPAEVVADQLGHANISTTLQVYRRVNPQLGRLAATAMGRLYAEIAAAPPALPER